VQRSNHDVTERQADDDQPVQVRSGETPRSPVAKPPGSTEMPGPKRGGANDVGGSAASAVSWAKRARLVGARGQKRSMKAATVALQGNDPGCYCFRNHGSAEYVTETETSIPATAREPRPGIDDRASVDGRSRSTGSKVVSSGALGASRWSGGSPHPSRSMRRDVAERPLPPARRSHRRRANRTRRRPALPAHTHRTSSRSGTRTPRPLVTTVGRTNVVALGRSSGFRLTFRPVTPISGTGRVGGTPRGLIGVNLG
jgi:hypothetical protein